MKILHYTSFINRTSGGISVYMQLLTSELVKLHVMTHKESNPLELNNILEGTQNSSIKTLSHIHLINKQKINESNSK